MFTIFTLICFVVTFYAQNITAIVIAVIVKVLRVGLLPETVKYVARTHKTAYAVYNKVFIIVKIFIRRPQFCYSANSVATSFLCNSHGHP